MFTLMQISQIGKIPAEAGALDTDGVNSKKDCRVVLGGGIQRAFSPSFNRNLHPIPPSNTSDRPHRSTAKSHARRLF